MRWLWVFVVVSVVGVVGCEPEEKADSQEETETPGVIPGTGVRFSVVEVWVDAVASDRSPRPDPGMKFVALKLRLDNAGSDSANISEHRFELKGAEGGVYEDPKMSLLEPGLQSQGIEGGDFVAGWIAFEVPEGFELAGARLRYRKPKNLKSEEVKSDWLDLDSLEDGVIIKIGNPARMMLDAFSRLLDIVEGGSSDCTKIRAEAGILIEETEAAFAPFEQKLDGLRFTKDEQRELDDLTARAGSAADPACAAVGSQLMKELTTVMFGDL